MTENPKTFTVVGATSDTGRVVKRLLEEAGHSVRPVARRYRISLALEQWSIRNLMKVRQ